MKNYHSILSCVALFGASLFSASAETIIVESRTTGGTTGGITPNPPYGEVQGNWSGSGSHTIAPGTTAGIGSRFASSPTTPPIVKITPGLQPNSTYRMSISHITINASPNLVVNITYEGCTGTASSTTAFNAAVGNVWETVGDITTGDGSIPPAIIFTYASGTLAGTGGRWYSDAFRFQNEPCLGATVPELPSVTGPLGASQTYVNVPGVASNATTVTVYADGVQIGQRTSGVVAGFNRVDTSALVKGQVITATQSGSNNVEGCRPTSGPIVGGGANPTVRLALGMRQDTTLTGPIGGNGGAASAIIKFLGATGVVNNVNGNAPAGARSFPANSEWQTVEFQRGPDPSNSVDGVYMWNGTDATAPNVLKGDFGVLDSLSFAIDDDTGPFEIYIDNFKNGSTLIQGFEGSTPGATAVGFNQPSFSGTTSPFLLSQAANSVLPNACMVTNNTSDEGAHSLFVSWQYKDTNRVNWLRLPAQGAGTPNPMLDLRLPISFRMLILPVGQTVPASAPFAPNGPGNFTVIRGGSFSMRVNVRGTGPFTYQWRHNGVDIPGATSATLNRTNVQASDAGSYSVHISNALGSTDSPSGIVTVDDVPYNNVMTPDWSLAPGSRPYLTNDGNTRSIAWSPVTGNLLVASRSANSNAIYVLEGDSGAFKYVMQPPAGGFVGGTLVLNQIAFAEDGTLYACNLTTDGATNNLKLYKWFGDYDTEVGILVWEGNPSGDPNVHLRWGDAMAVRGPSGAHEVIVSSSGTMVGFIQPDFPSIVTGDITAAPAGAFRLGIAMTPGDILWGKTIGSPLYRVQMDPSLLSGTILNTFTGLDSMTAIAVNPAGTLLAGLFVDTPDHFRLFDISAPGILIPGDTELFGTDNANANATGGIAFASDKVYALDSNNGLAAMNLDTTCLPDRLTAEQSGSDVILRWSRPSFHLEGTSTLGVGWAPIAGGSPKTLPATGNQFFRLVCP